MPRTSQSKSSRQPRRRVGVLYEIWWPEEEPVYGDTPLSRLGLERPEFVPDGSEVHTEIIEALRELNYSPQRLVLDGTTASLLTLARNTTPLIFNLVESYAGDDGKDLHVAAFLELVGKAFTGSGARALHLGQDKALGAKVLRHHGIPTPDFEVVPRGEKPRLSRLRDPLIVKPVAEDGSIGIDSGSVVDDPRLLRQRVDFVHEHFGDALVQSYIDGRELNAAIVGNDELVALPLVEIDLTNLPPGVPRIVGKEIKWWKGTDLYKKTPPVFPTGLSTSQHNRIQKIAKRAYRALGIADYGRIDLRIDNTGAPYVIEVNPNPWIGKDSEFFMAWAKTGRCFADLVETIIRLALDRQA